jgi:hypothetical protein
MKRFALSLGLVAAIAAAALAAPQAPLQAPTHAPGKAVQAPVKAPIQSPAQSPIQKGGPVQKGGALTAQADGGFRTYSYQPGETYVPEMRAYSGRFVRPSYLDAGSKAAGRY